MSPASVTIGSLAFVGPSHVPEFSEFHYVRVLRLNGRAAVVSIIDPDGADEDFSEPIDTRVLQQRLVEDAESDKWPGTFVGHPVAFVQPEGEAIDEWAYGVTTGYSMANTQPFLHVRVSAGSYKVGLLRQHNVIKVDWLNYALQTGAGINSTVLSALELLEKMDEVCSQCRNVRSTLPATVTAALSTPIAPAEKVLLIRPDTLRVLYASRQHIVNCVTHKKGKRKDLFEPPADSPARVPKRSIDVAGPQRATARRRSASWASRQDFIESGDSESDADDHDVLSVRRQNHPLGSVPAVPAAPVNGDNRARSTYRPSVVERQIYTVIGHPNNTGKDPQCVLESFQQAHTTRFRATPPVLRGLYDFGFGLRGLSVLHLVRVTSPGLMSSDVSSTNMTDFSRRNTIVPVSVEPSYARLMDAMGNLKTFGRAFYNQATVSVLEAADHFVDRFADAGEPDLATCRLLVFWIDAKLGKFRSLVVSDGLEAAMDIVGEFSRKDAHLAELLYDQQQQRIASLLAHFESKPTPLPSPAISQRSHRATKATPIPTSVLSCLPKQGSLQLCMKHLSKAGCTGNGVPGRCFAPRRAHFRPASLPALAKEFIDRTYGGLAPEFADL